MNRWYAVPEASLPIRHLSACGGLLRALLSVALIATSLPVGAQNATPNPREDALASADSAAPVVRARVGSGFGINEFRGFNTTSETQWMVDGEVIAGAPSSDQIGLGTRVLARLADNADGAVTQGDVTLAMIDTALRGPITQAASAGAPLKVLGQAITVNANTVLVNVPGNNVSQLTIGQLLSVSGQIDSNNSFVATRLELRSSAPVWRLTGFVTSFNGAANSLNVGTQAVGFQGLVLENCANPIPVGQYIEVRAPAVPNFVNGNALVATRLRCGAPFDAGVIGAPGVQDGLIVSVLSPTQFTMSNLTVNLGPTALVPVTLFRNGAVDDLEVAVRIEVEGIYSAANTLDARKIRFIYPQVRFEAPILPAAIVPGVSITILGNTVKINPQTRDSSGIGASGISAERQVRVRGYTDISGNLFATRVDDRGAPRTDRFRATGPSNTVATPNFKIFGLNINTSTSSFADALDNPITSAAFFAALTPGRLASISDAQFNAATNTLSGGVVSLEDDTVPNNRNADKNVADAIVSGVLTELALDQVFATGFE